MPAEHHLGQLAGTKRVHCNYCLFSLNCLLLALLLQELSQAGVSARRLQGMCLNFQAMQNAPLESRTGGLTHCVPAGGIAGLLNNIPEFTLPELPDNMRPSSGMRAASFDVMFLDEVRRSHQNSIS